MTARQQRTTAILGAGALGLTTAIRLGRAGDRVTVIEREALPGGLAAGFQPTEGVWLEKFYHHLFKSDTRAIAMIQELGLGDRLEWKQPITATLRDGQFHQLDSPASLLRFSPLPMIDRLRMGAALAVLKAMPNPRSAGGWNRRRLDTALDGSRRLHDGLGAAAARQVRRRGTRDRDALVLGARP